MDRELREYLIRLHLHSPDQLNARDSHVLFAILWITCLTCALVVRKPEGVSLSPPAGRLHPLPARTGSGPSGGAQQSEAGGVMKNFWRDLSDGIVRDEVTQLRSLRKLRFCLSLIIWTNGATRFRCCCICCNVMSYSILYVCIPFLPLPVLLLLMDIASLCLARESYIPLCNVLISDTTRHNYLHICFTTI